jgi:maltose alpha-D-glucosyltransferase / alpha-amylase
MKLYRRLQPGVHPELEVARFLTEVAGFENTPALLGAAEYIAPDGTPTALAVLQRFVRNQGDAWQWTLDLLRRELDVMAVSPEAERPADAFAPYVPIAKALGRRTGELHRAFATATDDPAFAAEPLAPEDLATVAADARAQGERAFAALARLPATAPEGGREAAQLLIARRDECFAVIERLSQASAEAVKTRIHGDYHLGQVLIVQDDVMIVDFEGEPSRPAEERRAKGAPIRDVAGMLRSFAYAAETAARDVAQRFPEAGARAHAAALEWRQFATDLFLDAYAAAAQDSPIWIADAATRSRLLRLHLIAKALYEINYEASNRPDWIEIPVRGVLSILDDEGATA